MFGHKGYVSLIFLTIHYTHIYIKACANNKRNHTHTQTQNTYKHTHQNKRLSISYTIIICYLMLCFYVIRCRIVSVYQLH